MINLQEAQKELRSRANPERAQFLQRFFKTGAGDYAEGDKLLGISVPVTRSLARQFNHMSVENVLALLESQWHEERLMAIFLLVAKYDFAFKSGNVPMQEKIYKGYLKRIAKYINNWDLVDSSAHYIVGRHLENRPRDIIYKLGKSKSLWEKRVAIISTFYFIRKKDYVDTLKISETLLNDSHDLIHKAVGWMLREVGNRSFLTEKKFLDKFAKNMPRTMLRYAIEKFPENTRKSYLAIKYAGVVK